MTSSPGEAAESPQPPRETVDQQARRKGVRPVRSVDDMAQDGIFDSDEDLEEFLRHVYAARRAELA